MNFTQWKSHAAKGNVAKVSYVCGDQPTLVEIVIEDIKNILQVPVTDFISIDADNSVWELASQIPLGRSNRLVVVRNADVLEDWSALELWLANSRANPHNYLVFVSTAPDAPAIYAKGKKVQYYEHIELIRSKGKFIKCSQPNVDDLVSWATSFNLSNNTAQHLVERSSGNTALMYDVLRKVHIWPSSPNTKVIDLLCDEQALESFTDCLVLRDKQSAYLALQAMKQSDKDKIISRLDSRLDMLMEIGKYVRRRIYAGDIAATTGINIFLVKKFTPVIKEYDLGKIKYCRQVLALVDAAIRQGAKTGPLETLIGLW